MALIQRKRSSHICRVSAVFGARLACGDIDMYGPMYITPERLPSAHFSIPICRIAIAALHRTRSHRTLPALPPPASKAQILKHNYKIAVIADSYPHFFARHVLGAAPENIVPCETVEEQNERITMNTCPRPAHLVICDAVHAVPMALEMGRDVELLFADREACLGWADNCIAIRHDMEELHRLVDKSIEFLHRSGLIRSRAEQLLPANILPTLAFD